MTDWNTNKINLVINCAALGDTICGMAILKAMLKEGRVNKILSNTKWIELMELMEIPKEIITYMHSDRVTYFDPDDKIMAPFYLEHRAPYRTHLVDFFSQSVAYAILKPEEKSLQVDPAKLPENPIKVKKYVVMQGTTRLKSRTMPADTWHKIRDYVFSHGMDVVVLGDPVDGTPYDMDRCITNHIGCNLATAIKICADAACVVGVDGGLIYIASLSQVPIVAGYTFVDPHYRAPWRNGIFSYNFYPIKPRSDCYYCTNSLCAYGIEFDKSCPKNIDFECQKCLHHDDFIDAISLFCPKK